MNSMVLSTVRSTVRLCASLIALFCYCSSPLVAQQAAPVGDPVAQSPSELETKQIDLALEDQPLAAIIEALSDQIGRGIVMDGKPLETRGSFKLHTTAKAALDQIAEHFDCSWKIGKRGAILMSKRFRQSGDLPQLHLKEMQRMAADLLAIWPENAGQVRHSHYPFTSVPISPGNALFRTFSSEQLKSLNGGNQLTFQDLSAEQKDLVRLIIVYGSTVTSHDIWDGLNARLAQMPYSSLQWRSMFHDQLDAHPTPFQYSLEYIWPDPQGKGYDQIVSARKVAETKGEKAK